jgi:transcription antitermination factor NusG
MDDITHLWCIAYINKVFLRTIGRDLNSFGYEDIKFNIPTVRILRKQFKGKNFYEEVPLLFNYGFFRIPIHGARDKDYLQRMKVAINGIYNWVYRPSGALPTVFEVPPILVSHIKMSDLAKLKRVALENSIFSSDEVSNLRAGNYIILRGYPFEGMEAEVLEVHPKKQSVKVNILSGGLLTTVSVNFANVFYSIYGGWEDPTPSDNTIEGLIEKTRVNKNQIYIDNG